MKAASLNEIKKELDNLEIPELQQLCQRLARYKKENKELLTYLLFEAHDEQSYVENIKRDVDELFLTVPKGNVYFVKKTIRKILRHINKFIRYSGVSLTELEVRMHFCDKMRTAPSSSTFWAYLRSTTSQKTFIPIGRHSSMTSRGLPSDVIM